MQNCEIIRINPPPPCEHMLPGGELNQPKWVDPACGGWEQDLWNEWEPILERHHLSQILVREGL